MRARDNRDFSPPDMTETFFSDLLETGNPYQKSIIFCASDNHASLVKINLQKIYNDWCEKNNIEFYFFNL